MEGTCKFKPYVYVIQQSLISTTTKPLLKYVWVYDWKKFCKTKMTSKNIMLNGQI